MAATVERIDPAAVLLSHEEIRRYSRHLVLPEVGVEGQKRLKAASVLIIGAGGLGSPAGLYLAAAGVGRIGIVDYDVVDESNLQRQIIHGTKDVGRPKIDSAEAALLDINPYIEVVKYPVPITSGNALAIMKDYDVILGATDNFPTRYLMNDASVMLGKPNIYGSIYRFEGQVSVFYAAEGPCYRCLFPEPPPPGLVPSCADGGVLGVLPGTIGTIMATEALKLIIGCGEPLIGRLLLYDAASMTFDTIRLRKNPRCPVCGPHPTITALIDYEQFCGVPGHDHSAYDDGQPPVRSLTVDEVKARLEAGDDLLILDVREPPEWQISAIEGTRRIPKDQVLHHLDELPRDRDIVVHCRTGVRSADVIRQLQAHGYTRLYNMAGGINAWARQIDPSLPTY